MNNKNKDVTTAEKEHFFFNEEAHAKAKQNIRKQNKFSIMNFYLKNDLIWAFKKVSNIK